MRPMEHSFRYFVHGWRNFCCCGSGCLPIGKPNQESGRAMLYLNWPSVSSRVTTTTVEKTVHTKPDDDVFLHPYIEFECMSNGHIFTGKQAVGKPINLGPKARQMIAPYSPGLRSTCISILKNLKKTDYQSAEELPGEIGCRSWLEFTTRIVL